MAAAVLIYDTRWQSADADYEWVDVPAGTVVELVDEPGAVYTTCGSDFVRIIVRGIDGLDGAQRLARPDKLELLP